MLLQKGSLDEKLRRASTARVHGDEAMWNAEWENFLGHWLAGEAAEGN